MHLFYGNCLVHDIDFSILARELNCVYEKSYVFGYVLSYDSVFIFPVASHQVWLSHRRDHHFRICQNTKYLPKAPRTLFCPKLSRKCTSMSNWYRHNYHYSAKGRWFSLFPLWRPSLKPTKLPAALHVPWTVHILLVFKRHLSCDCQDDDFVLVVWSGAGMRACWDQARSCCAARGCKHCKEHASVENIEPCTSPAGLWSSLWRYTRRLAVEDCQGGVVLPAVGKSSGTGTGRQRGHLLARPFSEDRCARIKDAYFLA